MAVRVAVNLKNERGGSSKSTSAVVNTGYESDTNEIFIPIKLAEELRLSLDEATSVSYESANGPTPILFIKGALKVSLDIERHTEPITCDVAVGQSGEEVLLSDSLIDELGIGLLRVKEGTWRLYDEDKERRSAKREIW